MEFERYSVHNDTGSSVNHTGKETNIQLSEFCKEKYKCGSKLYVSKIKTDRDFLYECQRKMKLKMRKQFL